MHVHVGPLDWEAAALLEAEESYRRAAAAKEAFAEVEVKLAEALRVAETFRARALDVTLSSFVFELTGKPSKLDAFIGLMRSLGDTEISRTGVSAISRGDKTETKLLEQI